MFPLIRPLTVRGRIWLVAATATMTVAPVASATDVPSRSAYVTNGGVNAIEVGGGFTYIGGDFTMVGPRVGAGMELSQSGAGQPDTALFPEVVAGTVSAVVADGAGGWFIGGSFTHVGGAARSGLAHITAEGGVDPTWNAAPPGTTVDVRALARSGSDLYVGGTFTSLGGQSHDNLAKVSTTGTGSADATWNPDPQGPSWFGMGVTSLAVSDGVVYVGGNFTTTGGQTRNGIAKLSASGAGAADTTWNPNPTSVGPALVYALAVSGSDLFVGGSFSAIGGQSRNGIAKLSTAGTGTADPSWNPDANAGSVFALAATGSDLYVGGSFTTIGGQSRNNIAKLSTTGTGAADATWNPNPSGGTPPNRVSTLAVSESGVFAGGSFGSIGGQPRRNLARLSASGTGAADPDWNPNTNGETYALAAAGSDIYVGGAFSSAGSANRERNLIARLHPDGTLDTTWDPNAASSSGWAGVSALELSGADLYVGGNFDSIGGQARDDLAKLSTAGVGEADATWNPNVDDDFASVRALALVDSQLYVGGSFTGVGGQMRSNLARVATDGAGAADPGWDPGVTGTVEALAASGSVIYVGGHFTAAGGQSRNHVAKLSSAGTGAADPDWNPNPSGGFFGASTVLDLAVSDGHVFAGGSFSDIGGQQREGLAKLAATGAGAADPTWNPSASSFMGATIAALAISGSDIYVGGMFQAIGGLPRFNIAKLAATGTGAADSAWAPATYGGVGALVATDSMLYAGGGFTGVGRSDPMWRAHQGFAQFDVSVPPAPVLTTTAPASPSSDNTPRVIGTAESGTTVRLYATSDCTGSPVATGTHAELADPGVAITVADDSTTTLRAIATNAAENTSECSPSSVTYVEDSTAPTSSATSPATGSGEPITVGYVANDTGSALSRVDLYVKGPADAGFVLAQTDSTPSASGRTFTHLPAGVGPYAFYTRAVDAAGNEEAAPASGDAVTTVVTPADTAPPILSAFRIDPASFAAARRGPSIATKPKLGTKVSYRLSEPAGVTFTVLRQGAGRKVGGKCRKRTRSNRTRPRCDLLLTGRFVHRGAKGPNKLRFTGRLAGKSLPRGRYWLVA